MDVSNRAAEVRARFADGSGRSFDLLVGADGIRSTVRGLLFPDLSPTYAGYVGWRGTLSERDLPTRAREELRDLLTYHVGDRTHVLSYEIPAPGGGSMNWVWYRNVPDGSAWRRCHRPIRRRHDLSLPAGGGATITSTSSRVGGADAAGVTDLIPRPRSRRKGRGTRGERDGGGRICPWRCRVRLGAHRRGTAKADGMLPPRRRSRGCNDVRRRSRRGNRPDREGSAHGSDEGGWGAPQVTGPSVRRPGGGVGLYRRRPGTRRALDGHLPSCI